MAAVTAKYLGSNDFNGLPATKDMPVGVVADLIKGKLVSLNRGDRHPNPHIKAFEPEPVEEQLKKLGEQGAAGCLYPEKAVLEKAVAPAQYQGRPFTLRLALGEPQLSFYSFELYVLERYRNDPRYRFDVDDVHGTITLEDEFHRSDAVPGRDRAFLQSFGFSYDGDMNRAVAVFLRYLHDLTPEHQRTWETQILTGNFMLHPDYYASSMGHWAEKIPILGAFTAEIHHINAMCKLMGRPALFRQEFDEDQRPRDFAFLLRPTLKEFNGFVHLLDKMLSENIDIAFFRSDVAQERETERDDGRVVVERKGSIQLLDEWLTTSIRFPDPTPKDAMVGTFKRIRKMRQKPAHAVKEDEFDPTYFKEQRLLVIEAYTAIRTLRQILANHPATAGYAIPDLLYRGEIRTY